MNNRLKAYFGSLLFFVLFFTKTIVMAKPQQIKFTDIEMLTFYKERFTTGRRLSPVPQLHCDPKLPLLSFSNCYKFQPNVVQCFNSGHDDKNVHWKCKADLDKRVKFSSIKVSCEGYDYVDDPYILIDSCALEYSLELRLTNDFNEYYDKEFDESFKISNFLTLLIMSIIMLVIYRSCVKTPDITINCVDPNETFFQNSNEPNETCTNLTTEVFSTPPPPYTLVQDSAHGTRVNNTDIDVSTERNPLKSESTVRPDMSVLENQFESAASIPNISFTNSNTLKYRSESPPPAYESDRVVDETKPTKEYH